MDTILYKNVRDLTCWNTRALSYKYLGPTDTKGGRVKLYDKRFKRTKTIPYDDIYNSAAGVAVAYLLEHGWKVVGTNEDEGIIIMSGWDSDKQL